MSIRCMILAASAGLCVLLLAPVRPTVACTGITLRAEDGGAAYGRTLEWGTFDLKSRLIIIPRGKQFTAFTPDGRPGLEWRGKYGVAGIDVLEKDALADAMNEKGLVAGLFYHPGFASYTPYDPSRAARSMGPTDVMSYLLTSFATLDEVREGMREVDVVAVVEPALGFPAPIHLIVVDQSGNGLVLEWSNGALQTALTAPRLRPLSRSTASPLTSAAQRLNDAGVPFERNSGAPGKARLRPPTPQPGRRVRLDIMDRYRA